MGTVIHFLMKKPAFLVAIFTLLAVIAVPLLGQLSKHGAKRGKAPSGWTKFEWPEKKAILFGHYAPTQEELALIDQAVPKALTAKPAKKRRILLFYKCAYPHASIATGVAAFQKMAKTGAYEVDISDDSAHFSKENLEKYDAVLLNNTVAFETFLNDGQRANLLEFVKGGKGLIGIHAAADACKGWKPGAEMIGGVFRCHPWTSRGEWAAQLESPLHPLNNAWENKAPYLRDEIYYYRKGSFSRDRSRVLLSLDMDNQRNFVGDGIAKNQKEFVNKGDDNPVSWIHEFGKGRVFYSNLGHNNFTFWNPTVLQHFLDGIQYALGDLPADATPSAKIADLHVKKVDAKKIIFLAGRPSHRSGDHEFRAGSILLANRLNTQTQLPVNAQVISGWPKDDRILDGAAAIVIYCDADSVHRKHYERLMELSEAGTGLFFMHYGVHPNKIEDGQKYYMPTVGGFMETGYSVNPHWAAELHVTSDHPVRRGCEKPIKVLDEWYYSLRYDEKSFPLVEAIPTKENMVEGSNLWNKNATDNYGKKVRLMWGFEKPDGTRGGGFTGGHYHRNWAIEGFRKVVLNAIVWTAGLEVPEGGVKSKNPDEEEINANLDKKKTMARISLPLKSAMEYRADILRGRAERRKAAEAERKKKKAAAEKKRTETKPARSEMKEKEPVTKAPSRENNQWRDLLDPSLSQWDVWMGVPHKTVKLPESSDFEVDPESDGMRGKPLGLNNDPLKVFSAAEENGEVILKISGQIYGGITTKEEFKNYHLTLQYRWGDKKWEPRLKRKRDSGLLLHCVGKHGAFWNVWKRCLECQIQEGDTGDFYPLAGTIADIPASLPEGKKKPVYTPGAELFEASSPVTHGPSEEKPNGEWNTVEIYTVGDKMIHVVNGTLNMVLLNTRQKTPHGHAPLTKGQIQIQSEAAEIDYRRIKIRNITEFPEQFSKAVEE